MKKLFIMSVLFIALTGFNNVSIIEKTYYYVVRGHLEGAENDSCNKWVVSNVAVRIESCHTESMIELEFGKYYQEKIGKTCAIRGIKAESFSNYEAAAAYQQKILEEYRAEGKETIITNDFVIECK